MLPTKTRKLLGVNSKNRFTLGKPKSKSFAMFILKIITLTYYQYSAVLTGRE